MLAKEDVIMILITSLVIGVFVSIHTFKAIEGVSINKSQIKEVRVGSTDLIHNKRQMKITTPKELFFYKDNKYNSIKLIKQRNIFGFTRFIIKADKANKKEVLKCSHSSN